MNLVMKIESTSDRLHRLADGRCVPWENAKPLSAEEARERLKDLSGWSLESGSIWKEFRFMSYLSGLDFACVVGKIAERENHHPDMLVGWRRVKLILSTHEVRGLSQNDFIMAAKSELEYSRFTSH
jgi:4a-hydroxytetrahydrobiopterin dehydratase